MTATLERTAHERRYWRAWAPPERLAPSAWAERYRRLTTRESRISGRWRNDNAPYLAGVMDMTARDDVEELTLVKAAQVGFSEAVRNALGCMAQQDGDPVLVVLPDEHVGTKIMSERLTPFFRSTPCLAELLSERAWDVTHKSIGLTNGFRLRLGWSGSPATQASDPYRWVINDEVDKFREWSGREADPISLGRVRTQTYGRLRKIINISTPTTRGGLIWREFEACATRLRYQARCPACGALQPMNFDRLKWEAPAGVGDAEAADAVLRDGSAWYECAACGGRWDETRRAQALRAGGWDVPERIGARVGMRIGTLECLWVELAAIAAEFLRSRGDAARMQNFRNSWLGEVFEQQTAAIKTGVYAEKSRAAAAAGQRAREVPAWAGRLIGTCDVQQDRLYVVLRAWGAQLRSRRVWHGTVSDFEELRHVCFGLRYPALDGGPAWTCDLLGVDSGYRSDEVYRFALEDPQRIKALKGAGPDANAEPGAWAALREARPMLRLVEPRKVSYAPRDQRRSAYDVWMHLVDVGRCKDWLAAAVEATLHATGADGTAIETPLWELNDEDDGVYNGQMASEHKVLIRRGLRRATERWVKKTAGAANHYWDCEVYQRAMAYVAHVDLMQPDDDARRGTPPVAPRVAGGIDGLHGRSWIGGR